MLDSYGREISYLRLSVTELCNLRCRYCMPEDGVCKKAHRDMLTEDEMIAAVEAAASLGIKKLRITGGEPLVKKNILSICARAAAVEGIEQLALTTNGTLLPELALPLRCAGVKRINLSLDTLNREKYAYITRRDELGRALAGLDAALGAGFESVKVNTVLIGGFNDDEIEALASLTKDRPITLRFIELMPMHNGGEFDSSAMISCSRVLEALPELEAQGADGGVAKLYRLPDAQGSVGLISPVSCHFCADCNRIRITADGMLKPCLHSAAELSLKGLDRAGMTGQIKRAILSKPPCHEPLTIGQPSTAGRTMNQIGG